MPTTKLGSFQVSYLNSSEFHQAKRDVWSQHAYDFTAQSSAPFIIDAGAHIGLATLYFKKQYPNAHIIAIEPNPHSRQLLEANVWQNDLSTVEVLPFALAAQTGTAVFYYFPHASRDWQLNSGIFPKAWNNQGERMPEHTVETRTLAQVIGKHTIDLLKMDIEGAETSVLRASQAALSQVQQLIVEFHPTADHPLVELQRILESAGLGRLAYYSQGTQVKKPEPHRLLTIEASRNGKRTK